MKKINNSEELLERIINNNLNDEDKNILTNIFKPKEKKPKATGRHRSMSSKTSGEMKQINNEKRRIKYKEDDEYRKKIIQKAKDYHDRKMAELGIEKKVVGRPRIYETKEEAKKANSENIKRLYHEKKTTTRPPGRPKMTLEQKIKKIEEKYLNQGVN